MTEKGIIERFYSKDLIDQLEKDDEKGTLIRDKMGYAMLQHSRGFRSFLILPDPVKKLIILDERYEKRIRWDGSLVIIISHEETKKLEKYVCNDKTGIVYVPAWNGEQRFRDCDDYFKKEED